MLEEFIGKDQQVIGEFLQQFCVDAKRLALDIVRACATGRPSAAAAAAHKLKSSSRSIGALKLGELCFDRGGGGCRGTVGVDGVAP